MTRLTITKGISGSGKSTWAKSQKNAIVVSRDGLREALFGSADQDYHTAPGLREREELITKVEHDAIKRSLMTGRDVISDNTNIQVKFVNAIAKVGYACDAEVVVKVFDVDPDVAWARNVARAAGGGRLVPLDVIKRQHEQFQKSAHKPLPERPVVNPYHGTPGKPKAFLFDIDGTVADMANLRGPYDLNVEVDLPRRAVIDEIRTHYVVGDVAIAMSGRKETCREATEAWLNKHNVPFDRLFMRGADDDRADNLIKADLFDEHVRDNFDVQFVLDDRDQVVAMWRKMGLDCFQVAYGEF